MGDNLNDLIQKKETVQNPNFNASSHLRETTGLNIDPASLPDTASMKTDPDVVASKITEDEAVVSQNPIETEMPRAPIRMPEPDMSIPIQRIPIPGMPPPKPIQGTTGQTNIMSPEEAGVTWEEKIDVNAEAMKASDRKLQEVVQGNRGALTALLDDAISQEEARSIRAEETVQDPEKMEAIYKNPDDPGDVVSYNGVESYPSRRKIEADSDPFNPVREAAMMSDDVEDLLPSYDDTEETAGDESTPPATDEEKDAPPDPSNIKAYSKYIRELEHADATPQDSVVTTLKDRKVDVVSSGRNKGKYLNDQAFMNAVTKFKKDNFATVSVPLVNSGFVIDIVGTGVVDLLQLYTQVNENTVAMDYEIEKMKVVMKNVVGTHPKVNQMDLRNMIHYKDYNMMAWAHVCATLDHIETVTNCTECGKPFRITSSPRALILNMSELEQRMKEVQSAESIEQYSLLTTNQRLVTKSLFEIIIGHPSYADYIRTLTQVRDYAKNLDDIAISRFLSMVDTLHYIRSIQLPSGVITANTYQNYMALNMLEESDLYAITEEIDQMKKSVITPQFGIAKVVCPNCGKTLTDLPYNNLDEMIFFHSTVSRMLLEGSEETATK